MACKRETIVWSTDVRKWSAECNDGVRTDCGFSMPHETSGGDDLCVTFTQMTEYHLEHLKYIERSQL